jgi:hypothetical protein
LDLTFFLPFCLTVRLATAPLLQGGGPQECQAREHILPAGLTPAKF